IGDGATILVVEALQTVFLPIVVVAELGGRAVLVIGALLALEQGVRIALDGLDPAALPEAAVRALAGGAGIVALVAEAAVGIETLGEPVLLALEIRSPRDHHRARLLHDVAGEGRAVTAEDAAGLLEAGRVLGDGDVGDRGAVEAQEREHREG